MAPYIKNTFSRRGLSRENVFGAALRLQGNESPGGAFKQASGLRQQMEGPCPDKRRGRDKHENKKYNTLNMAERSGAISKSFGLTKGANPIR